MLKHLFPTSTVHSLGFVTTLLDGIYVVPSFHKVNCELHITNWLP